MQRPTRIFYVGTYERDYPRNTLMRAALRGAGYSVQELHQPVWVTGQDKSALVGSRLALIRLAARMCSAYARLIAGLLVRRVDVDLAMFGFVGQVDLLVLGPMLRVMRKPIVFDSLVTLTDTLIEDREKVASRGIGARIIRQADRLAFRLADVVLADTDENRDYLCSTFGVPLERILVVPVGADEAVFTPNVPENAQRAAEPSPRSLKVLFYGTMIPLQGVETIVRAAKLLEHDDVEFELIGSGQTLASVKQLAEELQVGNLTFEPRVPYQDLPRRIAHADVVLGIFGGTDKAGRVVPNKVYQAMAMGAAIITRDSAAARRLLRDGESALLVPPADPDALAGAILTLRDPELRRRLGEVARRRFEACATLEIQSALMRDVIELSMAENLTGKRAVSV